MKVCAYCGDPAPENPVQSCCGEIQFEETEECPECGSEDTYQSSHEATFSAPECTSWNCGECGNQWCVE